MLFTKRVLKKVPVYTIRIIANFRSIASKEEYAGLSRNVVTSTAFQELNEVSSH